MKGLLNDTNRKKTLFKSYYCASCKQIKPCRKLDQSFCCPCQYQTGLENGREYNDYQQIYQRKAKKWKEKFQQLQLLRNYNGCPQCGSLAVDACSLYEENRLICQPCRMRKEGISSSPISFSEQSKWYKRYWKIDLVEWLETYNCLPVNAECARKWLKDKEHLNNCDCLESEAKELYFLFANSLKESKEKLENCKCKTSEKVRVESDDYAWCELCDKNIAVASKKRVIKNRNDPRFWGLEIKERILCGNCLASKKEDMPSLRKAEFNRYRKVGRL